MQSVYPVEHASKQVWTQPFENIEKGTSPKRKPGFPEEVIFELDTEGYVHLIGMNCQEISGRGNTTCTDIWHLGKREIPVG